MELTKKLLIKVFKETSKITVATIVLISINLINLFVLVIKKRVVNVTTRYSLNS